ncbi:hypothetical protein JHU04_001560 [Brenneria sp. 4F2]|nr:hypothetical protein [Brenneria bubanii]
MDYSKTYYSAEITLAYSYYKKYDYSAYFEKIRQIWQKKTLQ